MEVPSFGVFPIKKREKFFSAEVFSSYEAMEGACTAVISYLQKECFILIEDINFQELRCVQKRAITAESACALLDDDLDAERKNNEVMRDGYAAFFMEARRLCKDYSDVFPGGTIGYESTSIAPDDGKIYYGGPRPPVSRVEQFAFQLIELITRSGNVPLPGYDAHYKGRWISVLGLRCRLHRSRWCLREWCLTCSSHSCVYVAGDYADESYIRTNRNLLLRSRYTGMQQEQSDFGLRKLWSRAASMGNTTKCWSGGLEHVALGLDPDGSISSPTPTCGCGILRCGTGD